MFRRDKVLALFLTITFVFQIREVTKSVRDHRRLQNDVQYNYQATTSQVVVVPSTSTTSSSKTSATSSLTIQNKTPSSSSVRDDEDHQQTKMFSTTNTRNSSIIVKHIVRNNYYTKGNENNITTAGTKTFKPTINSAGRNNYDRHNMTMMIEQLELMSTSARKNRTMRTLLASTLTKKNRTTTSTKTNVNPTEIHTRTTRPNTNNTAIIYVHVGKTGGTTLNKALKCNCQWIRNGRERNTCLTDLSLQKEESMISNITKTMLHGTVRDPFDYWNDIETETHGTTIVYLVTVRNPMNRIISAFNYHHPNNNAEADGKVAKGSKRFYINCFRTIEDMTDILDAHPPLSSRRYQKQLLLTRSSSSLHTTTNHNRTNSSTTGSISRRLPIKAEEQCAEIGRRKLQGYKTPLSMTAYHMQTNYFYYGNLTFLKYPERDVWTIRTEHLWDDMNHLEQNVLGGLQEPFYHSSSQTTHGSEAYKVHSGLSVRGMKTLCCELVDEIQIYQDLLYRATNLNQKEKEEPMEIVLNQCDVQYSRDARQSKNNGNKIKSDGDDDVLVATIGGSTVKMADFSWTVWARQAC